jgi:hypothetical protein
MNRNEAQMSAAKLGLSTWIVQAIAVGPTSEAVPLKCVGFADVDLPLGEAETWEEALAEAARVVFSA